jgi:hypothetical protein
VAAAAALAVVLLLGAGRPASALSARPAGRSDAVAGSASVGQQDPESTSTTVASPATVQRSGDPVSDTQDAQVGIIVIALVIVAVLLTVCFLAFWRMTKPVPVAVVAPAGSRQVERAAPTTSRPAERVTSSGGKGSSSRRRSEGGKRSSSGRRSR